MTDIEMLLESNLSNISVSDFSEEDNVVKVKGFMAHEGVMNRQTFTKEKLEKAASSFIGRPVMKSHTSDVDEVIGKITNAFGDIDPETELYGISYEADIGAEHKTLISNIKRGFLSNVSMRIGPNQMPSHFCNLCGKPIGECEHDFRNNDFNPIVNDFHGKHLAIVTEPADKNATIMSFSDGQVEEFENIEDYMRRAKMSDQFEEKYISLMEDFNQFKDEKKDEIAKLEADFKEQKTQLEKDFADKVEENLKLQKDFEELTAEKEGLEAKVQKFEEDFAKIEEEKLSSLRSEVSKLNEEVHGTLTEEQINSFEEATLEHYVGLFGNIKKHMKTTVKPNVDPTNQYSEEKPQKTDDPVVNMVNMVKNL